MTGTERARSSALQSIVGVAALIALVAACTTSPKPPGQTYTFQATRITNITQNGDYPLTFWDPDSIEEPYLVHLGLRLTLSTPVQVSTFVSSTYANGGQVIGQVGPGQSLNVNPGDGATFAGVLLPDLGDLNNGFPLEILGSIEFLMERDQLIPVGIVQILQGLSQLINEALPPILGAGGIPSTAQGILDLISAVLPGVVSTIVGFLGSALASVAGTDQFIGLSPQFFLAVGGGLGSFLSSSLPSIISLVNFVLSLQNPNPFPKGLPLGIGVVGDGVLAHYGTAPDTSTYDVQYGWAVS